MKEFKQKIIDAIVEDAKSVKIVSLYKTAQELGYNHISEQDCRDILGAVQKRLPDYRPMQICKNHLNESLYTTLCFVQNDVEFDDGEDF